MKIKIDWAKVDLVVQAALTAAEQTAYAIRQDIQEENVVPREVGNLEDDSFIDSSRKSEGIFRLVYPAPYARRLYWHPEYNFRTDKNGNARGEWLEPWLTGSRKEFARRSFGIRFSNQRKKLGV